jgi:hypothetical protein
LDYDYNFLRRTNLLSGTWSTVLSGTTATNAMDAVGDQAFYKVELVLQPEN